MNAPEAARPGAAAAKAYLPAAMAAAGITAAVVFYTVIVEVLRARGYAAPVRPPAAYVLKYALYLLGLSPLAALKFVTTLFEGKRSSPEETLRMLSAGAIVKAAACELPALCGLVMFLAGGWRADFYLLAVFSLALEIYNFPRLAAWKERLRADFGEL